MKNTLFPVQTENEQRLPFFVLSVTLEHKQDPVNRIKGYPYYQWIQTRSGSGKLNVAGNEFNIGNNMGMFLLPNEKHEYKADGDDWVVDGVAFIGTEVADFFENVVGLKQSGGFHIADAKEMQDTLQAIYDAEQSQNPVKSLEISSLSYTLALQILKLASSSSTNSISTRYNRLTPVLDYIDEHYAESITLKQLSQLLGVTPQHLCTLFRKIMNTRIFEFINLVRIKKSKEILLANPAMPIRDVAHKNGFDDVSYFCYIFKRIEKTTPGDFRKRHLRN